MKKIVILSFILLTFNLFSENNPNPEVSKKTKIVVLPFKDLSNSGENISPRITSLVASKLADLGRFTVIDRTELDTIINEQKLALSGMVDSNQAVEVGKIAGAKIGFTGNIISLSVFQEEVTLKREAELSIIKVKKEKKVLKPEWNAKIEVSFKAIDIETGEVKKSITRTASYTTPEGKHSKENAISKVVSSVSDSLIFGIKELYALKSYIVDKDKNKVLMMLGEDMGIRKGMEFDVFSKSKMVTDKVSGKQLKVSGKEVGRVMITKVDNESAKALIVKGKRKVDVGDELVEKSFPTLNMDMSFGMTPFKISDISIDQKLAYDDYQFGIEIDQDDVESVPYLALNFHRTYTNIKPSLDLILLANFPLTGVGVDINLDLSKRILGIIDISGEVGVGGRYVGGKVGEIKKEAKSGLIDVITLILDDPEVEIKDGADVDLNGFGLAVKAKGKVAVNLSDSLSVFGEAGYVLSGISGWDLVTKDELDKEVELSKTKKLTDEMGKLELSGQFVGAGIRLTF